MGLRKLAGLIAGASLAIGLIGAGVGATFTSASSANENITVGDMSIQAALNGPGPNVQTPVACTVHVVTASGSYVCTLKVTKSGDIVPSDLKVAVTIGAGGVNEPGKWSVSDGSASGTLAQTLLWDYPSPSFAFHKTFTVTWTDLGNTSMDNSVTLVYTVTAYES
jgi:hypothetical protein